MSKSRNICTVKGCVNYQRYCRLHQGFAVKEVEAIAKQSDKLKEAMKEYNKKSGRFKKEHPACEARIPGICTGATTDVHHKLGRNSKEDLLNEIYWLAVCRACHNCITENSSWAIQQGYSLSRLSHPAKNQKIKRA